MSDYDYDFVPDWWKALAVVFALIFGLAVGFLAGTTLEDRVGGGVVQTFFGILAIGTSGWGFYRLLLALWVLGEEGADRRRTRKGGGNSRAEAAPFASGTSPPTSASPTNEGRRCTRRGSCPSRIRSTA